MRVPPHIDVPAIASVVVATDKASSKAANNRSTTARPFTPTSLEGERGPLQRAPAETADGRPSRRFDRHDHLRTCGDGRASELDLTPLHRKL
jgi:hypothetical protein